MFQESEIICLAFGFAFLGAMLFLARQGRLPRLPRLYTGVLLLFGAQVFTVAEGIVWAGLFDVLEHVCYALGGVFFAAGTWRLARGSQTARGGHG